MCINIKFYKGKETLRELKWYKETVRKQTKFVHSQTETYFSL